MSEEELFLWWHELPETARLFYTGSTALSPDDLPWRAFREYTDLDSRVYRPFNPDTMNWEEYKETSDYLVARHHERKKQHQLEDEARNLLNEKYGFALAASYRPDMELTMRDLCEGCMYQRPAQRDHRCLYPDENENSFL